MDQHELERKRQLNMRRGLLGIMIAGSFIVGVKYEPAMALTVIGVVLFIFSEMAY
jgi:hypothetical protein